MSEPRRVASPPSKPTLVFDGDCGFCKVWIDRWRETTGDAVEYVPQQAEEVKQRFPELDAVALTQAVHLVEPTGRIRRGAEAVFSALAGQVAWLLHFYETLPLFAKLSEWGYAFVARHRPLFAFLTRCLWGATVERPRYQWVRWCFLRGMGLVFLIAFVSLWLQILGLAGEHGILPVSDQLETLLQQSPSLGWQRAWLLPTFFWLNSSDAMLVAHCALGTVFSILLICDVAPALCAFGAWLLYLSLAGAAQLFLGYQWDNLLLEAGLLSVFFAPWKWRPGLRREAVASRVMVLVARWLVFRLMVLSGCVKLLSGDPAWHDLTALTYHYETQPLPTALAWYAHHLPLWAQKVSCVLVFALELAVPFLVFLPRRPRLWAFVSYVGFMIVISATGNYTFFNLLTGVLCLCLLDDQTITRFLPERWRKAGVGGGAGLPRTQRIAIAGYAVVVAAISIMLLTWMLQIKVPWGPPFTALYAQFAPFRSINNYGLFAVMTTRRPEITIEGSEDGEHWLEYEFKWKPGRLDRLPGWVAPHQPRLDWQMWFAAFGDIRGNRWLFGLCQRLLEGRHDVLNLLDNNPFQQKPPRYIRMRLYEYRFTTGQETGTQWWRRELKGDYLPPVSLVRGTNP